MLSLSPTASSDKLDNLLVDPETKAPSESSARLNVNTGAISSPFIIVSVKSVLLPAFSAFVGFPIESFIVSSCSYIPSLLIGITIVPSWFPIDIVNVPEAVTELLLRVPDGVSPDHCLKSYG